jgi:hypothetical protein
LKDFFKKSLFFSIIRCQIEGVEQCCDNIVKRMGPCGNGKTPDGEQDGEIYSGYCPENELCQSQRVVLRKLQPAL